MRNLKDAARETYRATDGARRAVAVRLVGEVAVVYVEQRELEWLNARARQTIDSREESLRMFKRRFEVGAIAKMDLVQVEVLLQQAQTLAAQLEQGRAVQAHALPLLVGSPLPPLPENTGLGDDAVAR